MRAVDRWVRGAFSGVLCGLKLVPAKWRCLVPEERRDGAQSHPCEAIPRKTAAHLHCNKRSAAQVSWRAGHIPLRYATGTMSHSGRTPTAAQPFRAGTMTQAVGLPLYKEERN